MENTLDPDVSLANVKCVVTLVIVDRIASTLLGLIGLGVVAGSPELTMVTDGTPLELHLERRAPVTGRHHQ